MASPYGGNINNYGQTAPDSAELEAAKKKVADLGSLWWKAKTSQERDALHKQANKIGTTYGGAYDTKAGAWDFSKAPGSVADSGYEFGRRSEDQVSPIQSGPNPNELINSMHNANREAQLQGLRKSRDTALQGLNSVETQAHQGAYANRNSADVVSAQNVQRLREAMANAGLTASGDNITASTNLAGQRQGAINDVNQAEQNTVTDVAQRRALINDNTAMDEQALNQQLAAARDNMLLGQMNADRGFNLQRDQFDYSKQTDQRNFDRGVVESDRSFDFQKATQEWNQNFQQGQFDWSKAQTLWERTFQEKNFQQQVKDAAAARGLQWANLDESRKSRIANDLFQQKSFDADQGWKQKNFDWMTSSSNPDNLLKTPAPSSNQIEANYMSQLNTFKPDQLKTFFTNEQANIVNDLGINGYNSLYSQYFDQYGLPKKR